VELYGTVVPSSEEVKAENAKLTHEKNLIIFFLSSKLNPPANREGIKNEHLPQEPNN